MQDTKENILVTALSLFAEKGFSAVSVRDIAGELKISQSALYKHYANKQDIFDHIIRRMEKEDLRRAEAFTMPEKSCAEKPSAYAEAVWERLLSYTLAQFRYWTEDTFAGNFRKFLTVEQYRSKEMTLLFQQYLSGGVLCYVEDLFREAGFFQGESSFSCNELAAAFYAPVYLMMSLYDAAEDKKAVTERVKAYLASFADNIRRLTGTAEQREEREADVK